MKASRFVFAGILLLSLSLLALEITITRIASVVMYVLYPKNWTQKACFLYNG